MNISQENITGICDLKCLLSFNYQNSNCSAQNNGFNIKLTYDKSKMPPVLYNSEKYHVHEILIFSPSVHLFENANVNGEIVVNHISTTGGTPLNISIPIVSLSDTTTATTILREIISAVSVNAPAQGEKTQVTIDNYSLNNIIPKKPYYSYTTSKNIDWIVFGKANAIPLDQNTLNTLSQIIKPIPEEMCPSGPLLFYNPKGPNSQINKEGIYIDCQPTGASEDQEEVTVSSSTSTTYDLNDFFNNSNTQYILKIIIVALIFTFILFIIYYGFKYIGNIHYSKVKINSETKISG